MSEASPPLRVFSLTIVCTSFFMLGSRRGPIEGLRGSGAKGRRWVTDNTSRQQRAFGEAAVPHWPRRRAPTAAWQANWGQHQPKISKNARERERRRAHLHPAPIVPACLIVVVVEKRNPRRRHASRVRSARLPGAFIGPGHYALRCLQLQAVWRLTHEHFQKQTPNRQCRATERG